MKIIIIQQVIPNYRIPLFNKLSAISNYDVTLISAKNPEFMDNVKIADDSSKNAFKTIYLKQKKKLNRFFYFPKLLSYIRQEKPDIIITQNMYYHGWYALIYPLVMLKLLKIPIIYWTIPQLNQRKKYEIIKPLAFKSVDAFLIYGEHGLPILKSYGVPGKKIFVAYNSIDTDSITQLRKQMSDANSTSIRKTDRLIFMGRLIPSKKVDLLLRAFVQVRQSVPQAELLIIGDGQEKTRLEQLAHKLNIEPQVKFLGKITSTKEKGKILLSAGIFVLPGMGGLAINEAMCYDLPIICSTADGTEKNLVYNDINGCIFKDDDVDDLAQKIIQIICNPKLRQSMSKQSTRIINENVNIHTMISGVQKAIEYVKNK